MADCVLGEARLISSASKIFVNTGPGWNESSRLPEEVSCKNVRAQNIAGHEVGRELDAFEIKLENLADGADERGFAEAGQAFQQNVAATQNADEHKPMQFLAPKQNKIKLLQSFAREFGGRLQFFRL